MLGPTKSGKTTLLATASEWLWEEHGKILFFNTAELGGFTSRVEQRIRQGLIRVFRMRTRDDAENTLSFETMQLASKGYVPARFINHLEGEVEVGVPMVAPMQVVHTLYCPDGHEVRRTRSSAKLANNQCPTCRKPVTLVNGKVVTATTQTPGFEMIGSFAFDGLTSFSDWYLQDMSHRKNLEGEKAALGGEIESGDMLFRGNNRSQVGMAQTRVHELVANTLSIPNLVVMPFWTAISTESSDDSGRLQIVGPKLAGDAKTFIACSWFGNVVEAEVVTNPQHDYIRRLHVSQFYDDNNRRHMCGHRGDPRFMPIHFEDAPYSDDKPPTEICTGFSLATFMRAVELSIQKGMENETFGGRGVPGMQSIPMTYGTAEDLEKADGATAAVVAPKRPGVARPRQTPKGGTQPAAVTVPATATAPAEEAAAETAPEIEAPVEQAAEPVAAAAPETPEVGGTTLPETREDQIPSTESGAATSPASALPAAPPVASTAAPAPSGAWTRPPGSRPPAPRAPQAGPKAPARSQPRPVTAVKAQ